MRGPLCWPEDKEIRAVVWLKYKKHKKEYKYMIELGKTQELEIVRTKEFGVYLSEKQEMKQQSFF